MSQNKRTFLFQINVTRDCNLRCTHCYISSDKKAQSEFMSREQYIETFKQIKDFLLHEKSTLDRYNLADIHVIGGEPTMLGTEFFSETMPTVKALMDEVKQAGINVNLSIVSNLVTPDAVKISLMFDMIATSYEIETRFVSAKGRQLKSLEQSWIDNVNHLQSLGREVTVTTAVTKKATETGAEALLDWFYEKGFRAIHLGFFIPSGDGLIYIDSVFPPFEETTKFMIEATEWYKSRRLADKDLYVNPIESMIESIYNNTPMDDIICPIIPGSLDVDWDGETVTCIEAGGEVDAESLGNIFTSSITEILESPIYRKEKNKAIRPQPHCIGCDELRNCQSACGVLHEFWDGKGECPGFKGFIKYIRKEVSSGELVPKSVALNSDRSDFRGC